LQSVVIANFVPIAVFDQRVKMTFISN
jgi:hypothetical protein